MIANHIYILLLPIALDLYLWFGPHLRIKSLMEPLLLEMQKQFTAFSQVQMGEAIEVAQQVWIDVLDRFNLFSLVRSYPVGVFSLFSNTPPSETPLGIPAFIEVPTLGGAFLYWLVLSMIGLLLGTIFFREIARWTGQGLLDHHLRPASWHYTQTLLLTLVLMVFVIFLTIPLLLLFSFVTLVSPMLAQIVLFIISIFLLWLLVPMVFSPHGIYFNQQTALASLLTSVRLVRFHLPGTGLFIMLIFLIGEGLNVIWRFPPASSWMAIIGVLGHAFISTALLAASFIYYRNGLIWMQARLHQVSKPAPETNGRTL